MTDDQLLLANAFVDGELDPVEQTRALADPEVAQEIAKLEQLRLLLAAPMPFDSDVADRQIGVALSAVADPNNATSPDPAVAAQASSPTPSSPMERPQFAERSQGVERPQGASVHHIGRSNWWFAAAAAVVALAVGGVFMLSSGLRDNQMSSSQDSGSATTALDESAGSAETTMMMDDMAAEDPAAAVAGGTTADTAAAEMSDDSLASATTSPQALTPGQIEVPVFEQDDRGIVQLDGVAELMAYGRTLAAQNILGALVDAPTSDCEVVDEAGVPIPLLGVADYAEGVGSRRVLVGVVVNNVAVPAEFQVYPIDPLTCEPLRFGTGVFER